MNNLVSAIIAIALLIGAFLLGRGCGSDSDQKINSDTTQTSDTSYEKKSGSFEIDWGLFPPDTVYDSFENVKYVDTGSTDTITRNDTHYVMLDYFRYRAYSRRFSDSNISIDVELGVAKNRLQNFEVGYEFDESTVNNTTTITETKTYDTKIWMGTELRFNSLNMDVSLDLGRHQIGIARTVLSNRQLKSAEKWGLRYQYNLLRE